MSFLLELLEMEDRVVQILQKEQKDKRYRKQKETQRKLGEGPKKNLPTEFWEGTSKQSEDLLEITI